MFAMVSMNLMSSPPRHLAQIFACTLVHALAAHFIHQSYVTVLVKQLHILSYFFQLLPI